MEALTRMVSESLARHGVETTVDYRRLLWSRWFRWEEGLNFALVPGKPGIFAISEELLASGEFSATGNKRMLALFHIVEAENLGLALASLSFSGSPMKKQMENGRYFVRYAVVEDAAQRKTAHTALQRWMASSAETAFAFGD
jgi:hypothetical protein